MAKDASGKSTAESLRATRTYGKFRCHNPTCMERLEPKKGQNTIKCPTCGMEFRVAWVKDGFPRCRGPVWENNRKIAEEAFNKRWGETQKQLQQEQAETKDKAKDKAKDKDKDKGVK